MEYLKTEMLRLSHTHSRTPAQHGSLTIRYEYNEKRAMNGLIFNGNVLDSRWYITTLWHINPMNRIIPLEFNRKHIEDILFENNSVNYFKNEDARESMPWAVFFTILVASIVLYDSYGEVYWQIYLVTVPMLLYYGISYYKTARYIFNYRQSVKSWLDNISKYKTHRLEISENSISVVMDNETTLQTWSSILSCKMDDRRIILNGAEQFYLPAKSMSSEDYYFLIETIRRKIKNDEL